MSNASRELAPAIMIQCDAWRLPRAAWRLPRGRPYRQPQLLGIAPTSLEYHKKAAQKGGLTCFFIGGLRKTFCL